MRFKDEIPDEARGATLLTRRHGESLIDSGLSTDIEFPVITEESGFPLMQKPSCSLERFRPNPLSGT